MISIKSLIARAADWLQGGRPQIRCDASVWQDGVAELRRRSNATRESGAFLLGNIENGTRIIRKFVYYDDIDPHCFDHGIVEFNGRLLHVVHSMCKDLGMRLVADVHVHPGGFGQSDSDQANPMDPRAGHIAMIIPNYARADAKPGSIGLYEFRGAGQWVDNSKVGRRVFALTR